MPNKLVERDHYKVLGVKPDDDEDELKRAYRKLAKKFHPDTLGPDPTKDAIRDAEEAFKEVSTAYEVLTDTSLRREVDAWLAARSWMEPPARDDFDYDFTPEPPRPTVDVPPAGQFLIGNVFCWVKFSASTWGTHLRATITLQLDDLFVMQEFDSLPHDAVNDGLIVVDAKGDVVGRGHYSLRSLRYDIRLLQAQADRNQRRREWLARIEPLKADLKTLRSEGRPVGRAESLLRTAERLIDSGNDSLRYAEQTDTVVRAIRELEKELLRIGTTDALEVLMDDLLNGKLRHQDLDHNQRLLHRLRVLEMRTGGAYEAPTREQVIAHYRKQLAGCRTHSDVQMRNLRIPDDTEVVMEWVADGSIEFAPDTVGVLSNKQKPVPHDVEYGFVKIDGKPTPVGIITVTHAAYERCSAQYGRVSQFPTLPHGILLLIRVKVKVQGQEVVSAARPDGKLLQNEVQRRQASLRAPREADEGSNVEVYALLDSLQAAWF